MSSVSAIDSEEMQKEIHLDEKTTLPVAAIIQKVQHKLLTLAVLEQQEISPILDKKILD